MFVCTLRKGGLRKLAVVAVCGVVLAGAAIYFLVRMGLKLKRKLARSGNGPAGKSEA